MRMFFYNTKEENDGGEAFINTKRVESILKNRTQKETTLEVLLFGREDPLLLKIPHTPTNEETIENFIKECERVTK